MVGRVAQVVVTVVATAVATAVVAVAVNLAVGALRRDSPAERYLAVGDCVQQVGRDEMKETGCSSEQAFAKVIKKYEGADFFGPTDCPPETDTFGTFRLTATVCLRKLNPPHPGDAGQGGGVLRAQDCISNPVFMAREVPCDSRDAYARLAAVVDNAGRCPDEAVQYLESGSARKLGLCVAPGLDVPGVGTCFSDPSLPFGGQPIGCGSQAAAARVVARVDENAECPAGTSSAIKDEVGLPARDTLCLAAL